jgi:hypothetical protein
MGAGDDGVPGMVERACASDDLAQRRGHETGRPQRRDAEWTLMIVRHSRLSPGGAARI